MPCTSHVCKWTALWSVSVAANLPRSHFGKRPVPDIIVTPAGPGVQGLCFTVIAFLLPHCLWRVKCFYLFKNKKEKQKEKSQFQNALFKKCD